MVAAISVLSDGVDVPETKSKVFIANSTVRGTKIASLFEEGLHQRHY